MSSGREGRTRRKEERKRANEPRMSFRGSGIGGLNHHARETGYFRSVEHEALMDRLRSLVARGKLDASVLEAAEKRYKETMIVVKKSKDIPMFEYVKGVTPVPRSVSAMHGGEMGNLGTKVSMGRMRWTSDGVSIFSVADGKKLAETAPKPLNHYENIRMMKIQKAAMQTPTVLGGYRLLPEMTPGRALMWGTIVAVWGTGALVMSTAKYLGIEQLGDVPEKMQEVLSPLGNALQRVMVGDDIRAAKMATSERGSMISNDVSLFASRLKERLV